MVDFKIIGAAAIGAVAIGLSAGSITPAEAAIFTGSISGSVSTTGGSVPGVSSGDPVTGSYSYDDSVRVGTDNPLTDFNLSIGTNPRVFTFSDLASTRLGRNLGLSTPTQDFLFIFFNDSALNEFVGLNPSVVSSQSISFSTLSSVQPQTSSTSFFQDSSRDFNFDFIATPRPLGNSAAVPEPTTMAGLALAGSGLAFLKRRRQQSIKA